MVQMTLLQWTLYRAVAPSPIPKVETGYSVSMGADQQVVSGQQVRIPVTVASSDKKITGFNAYDMTFTYDRQP